MGEEDEDEDADEDTTEYKPHAMAQDPRFNKGDMRFRKRKRVPWLEIFKRFPDRTSGAVRTRYHMLQGK